MKKYINIRATIFDWDYAKENYGTVKDIGLKNCTEADFNKTE
jgi:hypothetical protein